MRWRLVPATDITLRRWVGEWVVNDAMSGNTHLLDSQAGLILRRLQSGPATEEELAEACGSAQLTETLRQHLEILTELDVIEPCPV